MLKQTRKQQRDYYNSICGINIENNMVLLTWLHKNKIQISVINY